MQYCLYNAIKTPDGTVLWCETNHDYKIHNDLVSGEQYMNDGLGSMIRRSVNQVPYEDLSVWVDTENIELTEEVRNAKFWGSYGKGGREPKKILCLAEMSNKHIEAILDTQYHIRGTMFHKLFELELLYRTGKRIYLED